MKGILPLGILSQEPQDGMVLEFAKVTKQGSQLWNPHGMFLEVMQ